MWLDTCQWHPALTAQYRWIADCRRHRHHMHFSLPFEPVTDAELTVLNLDRPCGSRVPAWTRCGPCRKAPRAAAQRRRWRWARSFHWQGVWRDGDIGKTAPMCHKETVCQGGHQSLHHQRLRRKTRMATCCLETVQKEVRQGKFKRKISILG